MRLFVSGLVNVETTVKIAGFPLDYYPIDYPFFGIKSAVSGVGFNVAKALTTLGNDVQLTSYIGDDDEGQRALETLRKVGIDSSLVCTELAETPTSVVLYDESGRRQIHCDLKNIQERTHDAAALIPALSASDLAVLCNINFNRPLLDAAKICGVPIATDVHVLSSVEDDYNRDFLEQADILFLSDEALPCSPEQFITNLKNRYPAQIIVIGLGAQGALLYERATDAISQLPAANLGGVVNTVGAGDALFSAFVSYYAQGLSPQAALARAQVFAALKIQHNGAANGFPTAETVSQYFSSRAR